MTEVARYKTIATIAVAFSLGSLITAACGGGPTADANTAKLNRLQEDVDAIICVLRYLENPEDSYAVEISEGEFTRANQACGL